MNEAPDVAIIRLNSPERGNALSEAVVKRVQREIVAATEQPEIHTLGFIGEGRNFCTGFDLSDIESVNDSTLLERFIQVELLLDLVWRAPIRTVAIAQGRTWGAGADLFAACDVRLATGDATFRFPGAGFGLVLGTRRLAVRVGRDHARRLVCDGGIVDQTDALKIGLATEKSDIGIADLMRHATAPVVDRQTSAALRSATSQAEADSDLAVLVRSAARPGLQKRILEYRAAVSRGSAARAGGEKRPS